MKTQNPNPSAMSPATRAAVIAVLDTDPALSSGHRARILAACDSPADPGPAPVVWLTLAQAAASLGLSYATLTRWAASGRIQTARVGGRIMVSPEAVEAARAAAKPEPLPDRLAHLAPKLRKSAKG